MMKKISIIACLLCGIMAAQAQHKVISFFDEMGSARIQTEEFSQAHDTIVMVDHRIDDVIWARYIYRIIDMRYKQNYQLYFPTKSDDADYRNLFKVIADAVVDGLPIYEKNMETIKPDFKQDPLSKDMIPMMFMADDPTADYSDDPTHFDITASDAMLIHYDSVADELSGHFYRFEPIVKNQLKYLIQEVVFFDKHTSRLHQKIMAIAPLQSDNEVKRVTFDEFFQKRLFTSYIVGEGNMYNRWIPDYAKEESEVKKEQARIASELLTFEQDLWEY